MKVIVIIIDSIQIGLNTGTIICFYICQRKIKEYINQNDIELSISGTSSYQLEPLMGSSRRERKGMFFIVTEYTQ